MPSDAAGIEARSSPSAGRRRRLRPGNSSPVASFLPWALPLADALADADEPLRPRPDFPEEALSNLATSSSRMRLRRGVGPDATMRSAVDRPSPTSTPFLRSSSMRASCRSGESRRSRTSRVTQSGRHAHFCCSQRSLFSLVQLMSDRFTRNTLPLSRRKTSCSRGVLYSMMRALPSGVSMSVFFLGARLLKSLYASNS